MEMEEPDKNQSPTLHEQLEPATMYLVHATFVKSLLMIPLTLITVNSTAGLCIIYEKLISKVSQQFIEPINEIMLCSATNHRVVLRKMTKLYIRLRDKIFPYYFAVFSNLLPKILVSTSFTDKNIKAILPTKSLIYPTHSGPLPILAHNYRHVLAIQQPQPLESYKGETDSVRIPVANNTTIAPMAQQLLLVTILVF